MSVAAAATAAPVAQFLPVGPDSKPLPGFRVETIAKLSGEYKNYIWPYALPEGDTCRAFDLINAHKPHSYSVLLSKIVQGQKSTIGKTLAQASDRSAGGHLQANLVVVSAGLAGGGQLQAKKTAESHSEVETNCELLEFHLNGGSDTSFADLIIYVYRAPKVEENITAQAAHALLMQDKDAAIARIAHERDAQAQRIAEQDRRIAELTAALLQNSQSLAALTTRTQPPTLSLPRKAFGPDQWLEYFGVTVDPTPLPDGLRELLTTDCKIWPGKQVQETHMLALLPKTIGTDLFCLEKLMDFIGRRKTGHSALLTAEPASSNYPKGRGLVGESCWVLMTKAVLPNTTSKNYVDQQKALPPDYRLPTTLEAAASILLEKVRLGVALFSDHYIACDEGARVVPSLVGGFQDHQLRVRVTHALPVLPARNIGIAGIKIFT